MKARYTYIECFGGGLMKKIRQLLGEKSSVLHQRILERTRRRRLRQRDEALVTYTSPTIEETQCDPYENSSNSPGQSSTPTLLYQLAKRWAWEAVAFRCETHPDEVLYVDENDDTGDTILHWTCFGTPPLHVVEAILTVAPELAKIPNRQGNLPLHTACYYRASPQVIQALIEAYPEATGLSNQAGTYPLHIICDMGGTVECMRAILSTKGGVETCSKECATYQRSPLYILHQRKNMFQFQQALIELRKLRHQQHSTVVDILLEESSSISERRPSLEQDLWEIRNLDFWKKASMLLLVQHTLTPLKMDEDFLDQPFESLQCSVVHACIHLLAENRCPPSLLEFAVLIQDPSDLLQPSHHENNRTLPLHSACLLLPENAIWDILNACPKACQVPNPDGLLPIQIYLDRQTPTSSHLAPDPLLMRCFLESYPPSIEALKLDTKLLPYIWAQFATTQGRTILWQCIRSCPAVFATSSK